MVNVKNKLVYGILGGTFNPIHIGHLIIAEEVKGIFSLEKIIFIPCAQPPHKVEEEIAPADHRYQMTQLAIKDNPSFIISRLEIERGGKSYSVETVKALQEIFGESAKFYFITGADAILEISTWKNFEELLRICQFIALTRPGYSLFPDDDQSSEGLARRLKIEPTLVGNIHLLRIRAIEISAQEIRERIREGKSIRYLVPREVEEYIYTYRLYQNH